MTDPATTAATFVGFMKWVLSEMQSHGCQVASPARLLALSHATLSLCNELSTVEKLRGRENNPLTLG
jgi:hypothetical protein